MSLLEILSDATGGDRPARVPGVIIGLVTKVDEATGRVKLRFPVLNEEDESDWARIAVPMAGDKAGQYYMPEPGDECLCAFEQGDIRFPYVVGYLWGKDKPPATSAKKRVIQSRAGHVIELDDTPGAETITIKTAGGQTVQLADKPAPVLTIDAGPGSLKINCLNAQITAGSGLTINTPLAQFSGILMANVVQAQAVISASYSPGVGNIL